MGYEVLVVLAPDIWLREDPERFWQDRADRCVHPRGIKKRVSESKGGTACGTGNHFADVRLREILLVALGHAGDSTVHLDQAHSVRGDERSEMAVDEREDHTDNLLCSRTRQTGQSIYPSLRTDLDAVPEERFR